MNKPVYDLRKKTDNVPPFYNLGGKMEAFILSHASFFLILTLATLGILFVVLCYAIVGVSAVESGIPYRMEAWI